MNKHAVKVQGVKCIKETVNPVLEDMERLPKVMPMLRIK